MPEAAAYFAPYNPIFNSNGVPIPGAQVFFFTSTAEGNGTSTKAPIYADAELTVQLPNPVTANSASRLPAIYLNPDAYYRVVTRGPVTPSGTPGAILEEVDPFIPGTYPQGPAGPPGGNVMSIGVLADVPTMEIEDGADLIAISGNAATGDSRAGDRYVRDPLVTPVIASALPGLAAVDALGGGFRAVEPQRFVSVMKYIPVNLWKDIFDNVSAVNVYSYVAAALAAEPYLEFPNGRFIINDELTVSRNGQHIRMHPQAELRQTTQGKSGIVVINRLNFRMEGGALRGPGGWKKAWTGMSGRGGYRGLRLLGCTNANVAYTRSFGWGSAQMEITGGSANALFRPYVEGTNGYGLTNTDTVEANDNNQIGIYFSNDTVYGGGNDHIVIEPNVSNVAQGVLREAQPAPAPAPTGATIISGGIIHDIVGQHGIYNQDSLLTVSSTRFYNLVLSAVKLQSADAGRQIQAVSATGISASNIGGAIFEVASLLTGSIVDFQLQGTGTNCSYGATFKGGRLRGSVEVNVSGSAGNVIYINEADLNTPAAVGLGMDIDVRVASQGCGQDAVLLAATNARIRLLAPKIVGAGNAGVGLFSAIKVATPPPPGGYAGPRTRIDIFDPYIADANNNMYAGIFQTTTYGTVYVHNSADISGGIYGIHSTLGPIDQFPTDATVSGATTRFLGYNNIRSNEAVVHKGVSGTATYVPIWNNEIDPGATVDVVVDIVGKNGTEFERATVTGTFQRVGTGDATQGGAAGGTVSAVAGTAGFAGEYYLRAEPSSSRVELLVNSGGTATTNWTAQVRTQPIL